MAGNYIKLFYTATVTSLVMVESFFYNSTETIINSQELLEIEKNSNPTSCTLLCEQRRDTCLASALSKENTCFHVKNSWIGDAVVKLFTPKRKSFHHLMFLLVYKPFLHKINVWHSFSVSIKT